MGTILPSPPHAHAVRAPGSAWVGTVTARVCLASAPAWSAGDAAAPVLITINSVLLLFYV